jgi:hypothetical protein
MAVNSTVSALCYIGGGRAIGRLVPMTRLSATLITRGYSALSTTILPRLARLGAWFSGHQPPLGGHGARPRPVAPISLSRL